MIIPFPLSTYDGKVTRRQSPNEIWVNGKELPTNIARNIINTIEIHDIALVAVIGSESINQFVKGLAIAREMRREKFELQDLYATPYFSVILDVKERERTRMVFCVFPMKDEDVSRSLHTKTTQHNSRGSSVPSNMDKGNTDYHPTAG